MRKRFLNIPGGMMAAGIFAATLAAGVPQTAQAQAQVQAQAVSVTGEVLDESGEPLIGATVAVKGTSTATSCDLDGKFSIRASKGQTLVVSYVGYQPKEVKVDGSDLRIVMTEDSEMLSEVVVVGYGTAKRESLSGAVTVVDAKAFKEKGNLSSPLQALQGQVAGVNITRSSSAPGDEGWSMNLRGASSINATEPLIVIDGVASESVNDLRLLNSNDIESINFLKDGAAAIYGSRAAGGVVLITTKRGSEGKVKVEYNGSATLRHPGLMPKTMDYDTWVDGLKKVLVDNGMEGNPWMTYANLMQQYKGTYIDLSTSPSPFGDGAFTDVADFVFMNDVDWVNGLFGDAWSTEHNLSLSGGDSKNRYRISLGYMYDGSTLKYGNNNNQRYNIRFNHEYRFSERVNLQSVVAYNRQERVRPTMIGDALNSTTAQPGLPMTTIDGRPYQWGTWGSPTAKVELGGDNKYTATSINISETLGVKITDWLDANVNLGYNSTADWEDETRNHIQYYNYAGTIAQPDTKENLPENTYSWSRNRRTDFYSATAYLHGGYTFAEKHNLDLTVGWQYEFKDYRGFGVNAKEILQGLEVVNGTSDITLKDVNRWQFANMSYFFRFNYDFDSRYLLEVNGRYDGSSKFQGKNRWDFFYGVSAAWRINQEHFLRHVEWLSNLKLRASYAEMGNQSGIGNYDGYQLYGLHSNSGAYIGSDLISYISTNGRFASQSRTWERIKNFNVGLDFGFFNGALSASIDYFEKHNDNMLIGIALPATLGDTAPSSNVGKFKDWGFDGEIRYNGRIGEFGYHVGGNITFARNEITDIRSTEVLTSGFVSHRQGYPINSYFGLRYGGKIENEEMRQAYLDKYFDNNGIGLTRNIRVGDNMFVDENGDGVLDQNDYIFLGSDVPEITYSFNAGVNWRGFDVNVVFQGAGNKFVYRGINNYTVPFRGLYNNTTAAAVGDAVWYPGNNDAYYNPYTNNAEIINYDYQASSLTVQDGRYIRLKELNFGYTLPERWMKATHCLTNARIYVSGQDLWEWTKIKDGVDPEAGRGEIGGVGRYPFTRNWTFGLNLTF